ncbi:MAG: hypothetical protein WD530_00070 [Vicingaceae bacterium]
MMTYVTDFPFQEGIYLSYEEFKDNAPAIQSNFERSGSSLYVFDDSLQEMVLVNPNRVWGYSQSGNIYISYDEAYWRIINIGALSHFSAIVVSTFQTIDAFGFPVEQRSKRLKQLFLDFESGEIYPLEYKALAPYIEQDPILNQRFKKIKRKRDRELIVVLKAFNELHPIQFPVYE